MRTLIGGLLFVALSAPFIAQACFAPKAEQFSAVEDLVQRSSNIYLALAKSKTKSGLVEFKVIEKIKGTKLSFTIAGVFSESGTQTDFDRHRAKAFWGPSGGPAQVH